MKALLSKFIPFFSGIATFSLFGIGPTTIGFDLNDLAVWIFRSFVGLSIAVIAYFLKGMIDDNKEEDKKRDKRLEDCDDNYKDLIKVTAAHEVMYQIWLEDLANYTHPVEGNRKTDKIHRLIQSLAEVKKEP